ncbi:uncharacterized protein [Amphiura filiformis]|uniref:uncharacterized protein n=1 Tax=Amphiura filiformis TaxID=82378 RepID=UPI003B21FFA6
MLPESQCVFRTSQSSIDPIFTLRQLQEKSIKQQIPLYMVFIDFTKAFDTIDRELLWKLLEHYGCPYIFVKIIREFHDRMQATALVDGDTTEPFPLCHGVKQGCVLAPTLFGLYLAAVLEISSDNLSDGQHVVSSVLGQMANCSIV